MKEEQKNESNHALLFYLTPQELRMIPNKHLIHISSREETLHNST